MLPARVRPRAAAGAARRILLLRLERIGDLLMTLSALEAVRATWPDTHIDLVVGSWNADLASRFPWVDTVEALDAPWLARGAAGASLVSLVAQARAWRHRRYDLAINFEGDIRSNLLLALSGAPVRIGFPMAGGGPVLTDAVPYDPMRHTDDNTRALVRRAAHRFNRPLVEPPPTWPRLAVPGPARARAAALLRDVGTAPVIGLHASGGRPIKHWHPVRFGEAVGRLAEATRAHVVLTGAPDDRPLVDGARAGLPSGVNAIDLAGSLDLLTLAAVLERLALFVTGDTGPMHLAAALGVPVLAVFGLTEPARYGPLAPHRRIVRIDLPCSPCNRVRRPPERCQGHVPDCLEGITADMVYRAGLDLLAEIDTPGRRRVAGVPPGAPAS
jgi:ADP-heptose:LPS heptosyltransferase